MKKSQNAPWPSNDISTDVQIFRQLIGVPDYSIVVSRMEENKNM